MGVRRLLARERTGNGVFIDQAMYDSCISLLDRSVELVETGAAVLVISRDGAGPDGSLRVAIGDLDAGIASAVAIVPLPAT